MASHIGLFDRHGLAQKSSLSYHSSHNRVQGLLHACICTSELNITGRLPEVGNLKPTC